MTSDTPIIPQDALEAARNVTVELFGENSEFAAPSSIQTIARALVAYAEMRVKEALENDVLRQ